MEYFDTHPTIQIGVQSYGKSFGEIFTPTYLKHDPNESTESFLDFCDKVINPENEECNGTSETQEKEESTNNLS